MIRQLASSRSFYASLILLDTPGWIAYRLNLALPPSVESSPVYIGAGITLLALNAVFILAYLGDGLMSLVEYLKDR